MGIPKGSEGYAGVIFEAFYGFGFSDLGVGRQGLTYDE